MPRDMSGRSTLLSRLTDSALPRGFVMWKKWLACAGVLALVVLLDPTPTPAQPGSKREFKGFGPPGGSSTAPGTPGAYPAPGGSTYPAPGTMPPGGYGYGRPREGGYSSAPSAPGTPGGMSPGGTGLYPAP